jgi:hypothetical protein
MPRLAAETVEEAADAFGDQTAEAGVVRAATVAASLACGNTSAIATSVGTVSAAVAATIAATIAAGIATAIAPAIPATMAAAAVTPAIPATVTAAAVTPTVAATVPTAIAAAVTTTAVTSTITAARVSERLSRAEMEVKRLGRRELQADRQGCGRDGQRDQGRLRTHQLRPSLARHAAPYVGACLPAYRQLLRATPAITTNRRHGSDSTRGDETGSPVDR